MLRCERRLLTRAPAIERWITSTSAQKRTVCPARCGPSQNCRRIAHRFPDGGTTRSNSTGPPSTRSGVGAGVDGSLGGRRGLRRRDGGQAPGSQSGSSSRCSSPAPAGSARPA